jgi:hypothetical protein
VSIRDWFRKKPTEIHQPRDKIELVRFVGHPELEHGFFEPSQRDLEIALQGWDWIDLSELRPIAVSSFGDVFFLSEEGPIVHLDWIEGTLTTVSQSLREFEESLDSEEVRDRLILMGFVLGARARGLLLEAGECYDFKVPPVLGGAMDGENVQKLSFAVKLNMAGQIHDKVRNLEAGSVITGFKLLD